MGWVVYKGSGRNGAPDKVFLKNGRGFTCEMKTLTGVQSNAQRAEQHYLEDRCVDYYLIRTIDEMKGALLEQENKFE